MARSFEEKLVLVAEEDGATATVPLEPACHASHVVAMAAAAGSSLAGHDGPGFAEAASHMFTVPGCDARMLSHVAVHLSHRRHNHHQRHGSGAESARSRNQSPSSVPNGIVFEENGARDDRATSDHDFEGEDAESKDSRSPPRSMAERDATIAPALASLAAYLGLSTLLSEASSVCACVSLPLFGAEAAEQLSDEAAESVVSKMEPSGLARVHEWFPDAQRRAEIGAWAARRWERLAHEARLAGSNAALSVGNPAATCMRMHEEDALACPDPFISEICNNNNNVSNRDASMAREKLRALSDDADPGNGWGGQHSQMFPVARPSGPSDATRRRQRPERVRDLLAAKLAAAKARDDRAVAAEAELERLLLLRPGHDAHSVANLPVAAGGNDMNDRHHRFSQRLGLAGFASRDRAEVMRAARVLLPMCRVLRVPHAWCAAGATNTPGTDAKKLEEAGEMGEKGRDGGSGGGGGDVDRYSLGELARVACRSVNLIDLSAAGCSRAEAAAVLSAIGASGRPLFALDLSGSVAWGTEDTVALAASLSAGAVVSMQTHPMAGEERCYGAQKAAAPPSSSSWFSVRSDSGLDIPRAIRALRGPGRRRNNTTRAPRRLDPIADSRQVPLPRETRAGVQRDPFASSAAVLGGGVISDSGSGTAATGVGADTRGGGGAHRPIGLVMPVAPPAATPIPMQPLHLNRLSLSRTPITLPGAMALAAALPALPMLTILELNHCGMGERGVAAVCQAIGSSGSPIVVVGLAGNVSRDSTSSSTLTTNGIGSPSSSSASHKLRNPAAAVSDAPSHPAAMYASIQQQHTLSPRSPSSRRTTPGRHGHMDSLQSHTSHTSHQFSHRSPKSPSINSPGYYETAHGSPAQSAPARGLGHTVATRLLERSLASWQTLTRLDLSSNWVRGAEWKALSISLRGNTQLVHLDLSDTGMGAGTCSAACGSGGTAVCEACGVATLRVMGLMKALARVPALRWLSLSQNALPHGARLAVASLVATHPRLTALHAHSVGWDPEGALAIAGAIAKTTALRVLDVSAARPTADEPARVSGTFGDDGCTAIAKELSKCTTVSAVAMRHHRIRLRGCTALLWAAGTRDVSSPLAGIDLEGNLIGDDGALAIARSARRELLGRQLNMGLDGNPIGREGLSALHGARKKPGSYFEFGFQPTPGTQGL